jgi:hypothetical protein
VANTRLRSPGVYHENHKSVALLPHQVKFLLGRKDVLVTDATRESEWLSNAKIEICAQCKVAMLCYARRELAGYWCVRCIGWFLLDLGILIQCTEFQGINLNAFEDLTKRFAFDQKRHNGRLENPCCIKRRYRTLEIIGGMIVRHEP